MIYYQQCIKIMFIYYEQNYLFILLPITLPYPIAQYQTNSHKLQNEEWRKIRHKLEINLYFNFVTYII